MEEFGGNEIWGSEQLEKQQWQESNETNEEAVQRIRENTEKAKKVAQQIHSSKQTNHKFADFLTFLMWDIQDETIVKHMYQVFFKTKNPKDNIKYLRKNINLLVISGVFAPFYKKEIQHYGLYPYYEKLYNFNTTPSLEEYLWYLKKLSKTYHDNIPIDKSDFLTFLVDLIIYYRLTTPQLKSSEWEEETTQINLYKHLEDQLFG